MDGKSSKTGDHPHEHDSGGTANAVPLTEAERLIYATAWTATAMHIVDPDQHMVCSNVAETVIKMFRRAVAYAGPCPATTTSEMVRAFAAESTPPDREPSSASSFWAAAARHGAERLRPTYEPPQTEIQAGSFWVSRWRDGKTVRVRYAAESTITYSVEKPGRKPRSPRAYGPPVHYRRDRFLARFKRVSR